MTEFKKFLVGGEKFDWYIRGRCNCGMCTPNEAAEMNHVFGYNRQLKTTVRRIISFNYMVGVCSGKFGLFISATRWALN